MPSILIKNGELITATDRTYADVFVKDGIIQAVGKDLGVSADESIDADGCYVIPGGIDVHTHLDMPFMGEVSTDDFETGTAAGLAGGTTSLIDYVVPGKGQSLLEALDIWRTKSAKAVSDYSFHMAITWFSEQVSKEMGECVAQGIPSFKAFLAYKGAIMVDDDELMSILKRAGELNALIMAHCENGDVVHELQGKLFSEGKTDPIYHAKSRPSWAEGESAQRLVTLARAVDVPVYFVHMSTIEAVKVLMESRAQGLSVFGETCPQYLLLQEDVYLKPDFQGAAYVMSPPIRTAGHGDALWGALKSGQIETIATDHCPFNLKGQKEMGRNDFRMIPNGAAGIENRLALTYTYGVLQGKISLNQWVAQNSTRPAQLFGMYPRKGSLNVGAHADIVVWDPAASNTISAATHHHNVDTNIFEGFATKGEATHVIAGGRVKYADGKLDVTPGEGRFIKRKLDHHIGL